MRGKLKIGSPDFVEAGIVGEIRVSLGEEGLQRLVDQTHADVNAIRALRGLPPYDFTKGPAPSRKGKRHLQRPTKAIKDFLWRAKDYKL